MGKSKSRQTKPRSIYFIVGDAQGGRRYIWLPAKKRWVLCDDAEPEPLLMDGPCSWAKKEFHKAIPHAGDGWEVQLLAIRGGDGRAEVVKIL